MDEKTLRTDLFHLGVLAALLFVLWYAVGWYFGCNVIPVPYSCDVFWGVTRFSEGGKARVLIVYGDGGMGDHELLAGFLSRPGAYIAPATTQHISRVTLGNLKEYDLVVVEEARELGSSDLEMFMDYVSGGGRLVWTGDAGTIIEKGDRLLYEYERPGGTDQNRVSSAWARKVGTRPVAFDEFLSLDYVGTFCDLKTCNGVPEIGIFSAPNREHELVRAITPTLRMFGDFAIVEPRSNSYSTTVLTVDALSDIIADKDVVYSNVPTSVVPQCVDQIDNDRDGFIDFEGIDLDKDGKVDILRDAGCSSRTDDFEGGAQKPKDDEFECNDAKDNDRDGKIDYPNDECCATSFWQDEASCFGGSTECSDGVDNDSDGEIDFGPNNQFNDSGCYSSSDESEGDRNLGRVFPIIVASGAGQKVAYYAIPPEFFISNQMPIDPKTGQRIYYPSLVENMYYGMIK